jgi:broad specificity phosphatase PhoE
MPLELILIRHGQSEQNAGLSTDPNSRLSPLGREQSEKVAAELRDLEGFTGIVSPYRRARETARAIAEVSDVEFEVDEAVREWGNPVIIDGCAYPLERIEEVVDRLRQFLINRRGQRLVIVSHATPISILTHLARGHEPVTTGEFWADVENCCLRRITPTR